MVLTFRALGNRNHPPDEDFAREVGARSYDRGANPAGFARQMAAICASPSRRMALAKLTMPTLVIHGTQDPLIPVAAGRATARAIPNARLLELGDMGHDLPRPLRRTIANAIRSLAEDARDRR
jgi:pimeloyl-ACP methyl ester carboxylesterase